MVNVCARWGQLILEWIEHMRTLWHVSFIVLIGVIFVRFRSYHLRMGFAYSYWHMVPASHDIYRLIVDQIQHKDVDRCKQWYDAKQEQQTIYGSYLNMCYASDLKKASRLSDLNSIKYVPIDCHGVANTCMAVVCLLWCMVWDPKIKT